MVTYLQEDGLHDIMWQMLEGEQTDRACVFVSYGPVIVNEKLAVNKDYCVGVCYYTRSAWKLLIIICIENWEIKANSELNTCI